MLDLEYEFACEDYKRAEESREMWEQTAKRQRESAASAMDELMLLGIPESTDEFKKFLDRIARESEKAGYTACIAEQYKRDADRARKQMQEYEEQEAAAQALTDA